MKKKVYYLSATLLLALCVFIMNGGDLFKRPLGTQDDFVYYMNKVWENAEADEWEAAAYHNEKLNQAWKKVTPRIQFSVEKDEIDDINTGLARLNGSIAGRDLKPLLVELCEINEYWDNLNR